MKTTALIAVLAFSTAALAADIDRYTEFHQEGVFDATVSNRDANAIVREGIESGDSEIVAATVAALGWFAAYQNHSQQSRVGPLPRRSFSSIPGLKAFLVSHWREQYERSGYNAFNQEVLDEVAPTAESMTVHPSPSFVWRMIPSILCTLYPGDAEVHDLVWDIHAREADPGHWLATHRLLTIGQFTTAEANAYRMRELARPRGEAAAHVAVSLAAEGLALSRPLAALPLLVAAGVQYPVARDDILIALAAYGDEQLATHSREIAPLLNSRIGTSPSIQRAFERLKTLAVD